LPILKELNHITMKKTFSFTEFTFNVALLRIHFYNHCTLLIVHKVKKANTSRILYCAPKKSIVPVLDKCHIYYTWHKQGWPYSSDHWWSSPDNGLALET
jgi:hypothetical protein